MRNGFVIGARIIYGKTEKTHLVCVLQGPHRGHTGATQRPHKGHTRAAGKNRGFCNISRFKIEVSISEIFKRDMLQKPYFLPVALVWPLCGPCVAPVMGPYVAVLLWRG